ncbi:MAG: hypothetical protein IJX47_03820 [Clostridia bacterium]|nr:hypothetical protein [Clostridia bacterium]
MKNNDESYNQLLADLRRNSGASADDEIPSVKNPSASPVKSDASKPGNVLNGKTQSLDDRINRLEVSQKQMQKKLSDHYSWVAAIALIVILIEVVGFVLWIVADVMAESLDARTVAAIVADGGFRAFLLRFHASTSLTTVVFSVIIIIVSSIVYKHYKNLSDSIKRI